MDNPATSDKTHINGAKPATTPQTNQSTDEISAGDVAIPGATADTLDGPGPANLPREESQAEATRRWRRTGIAEQVAVYRDRKREEYSRANPKAKRRDAHEYAWLSAMAEFPPPGIVPQIAEDLAEPEPEPEVSAIADIPAEPEPEPAAQIPPPSREEEGVPGLGELPESWGTLPANASLQVEISWVSANRLRVRDGSGVDLSKALSPAPSYSALSWLETSILFPSKFADISVKATQNQEDEKEHVRRERMAIDEVRSLLAEMLED
jgi:hypothetical protein